MPRRSPGRLRAATPPTRATTARGLPDRTAHALDRLDDPHPTSAEVAHALQEWAEVVGQPQRVLSAPHNDWAELIGPSAREVLEDAVQALGRRAARPLRAELARLDADFERKTSHNPFADPSRPWWARRWWH